MTSAPKCVGGGLVGGPNVPIPSDPKQYRATDDDRIGCNRLFCPVCKHQVRHTDGRRLADWWRGADAEAFYDTPDPASSRFVISGGANADFRVYFCRCHSHSVGGPDDADLTDYGWSCAGHPQ